MSVQESVKEAIKKYKEENEFEDLFPEDNMITKEELNSTSLIKETPQETKVFELPKDINKPSQTEENPPSSEIKVKKVKKTKPKKKPKRKRCTMCNTLIPIENFENPEEHECMKLKALLNKEPQSGEETLNGTPKENHKRPPKFEATSASKNLYNLQFTTYFMIESSLKSAGRNDMDGLTETMENMKEQYLHVFEQVYDEYGNEYIDEVLSPAILWAMLTTQNIGSTYLANKKKESSTE